VEKLETRKPNKASKMARKLAKLVFACFLVLLVCSFQLTLGEEEQTEPEIDENEPLHWDTLHLRAWSIRDIFETKIRKEELPQLKKFRGALGMASMVGMTFPRECTKAWNKASDRFETFNTDNCVNDFLEEMCELSEACLEPGLEELKGFIKKMGNDMSKVQPKLGGQEVTPEAFLESAQPLLELICLSREEIMK